MSAGAVEEEAGSAGTEAGTVGAEGECGLNQTAGNLLNSWCGAARDNAGQRRPRGIRRVAGKKKRGQHVDGGQRGLTSRWAMSADTNSGIELSIAHRRRRAELTGHDRAAGNPCEEGKGQWACGCWTGNGRRKGSERCEGMGGAMNGILRRCEVISETQRVEFHELIRIR